MCAAVTGIHHQQYVDLETAAPPEKLIGLWGQTLCGSPIRPHMQLIRNHVFAHPYGALIHPVYVQQVVRVCTKAEQHVLAVCDTLLFLSFCEWHTHAQAVVAQPLAMLLELLC